MNYTIGKEFFNKFDWGCYLEGYKEAAILLLCNHISTILFYAYFHIFTLNGHVTTNGSSGSPHALKSSSAILSTGFSDN